VPSSADVLCASVRSVGSRLAADHPVHDVGVSVCELAPPQVLVARQERRVGHRAADGAPLDLGEGLQAVQAPQDQKVGDLLDHPTGCLSPD
jgi:hypothetical protein